MIISFQVKYPDFDFGRPCQLSPDSREAGLPLGHCRPAYSIHAARQLLRVVTKTYRGIENHPEYRLVIDL
jgi:hypothetical protein